MEIISVIPARGGSTEIPMKNLVLLNKKPLLYYTVTASLNSSLISRTVVSTDHEKIAKKARLMGAEVISRPKKLSGNKIGLESALIHALNYLERIEGYIPDVVVTLQNTSPLRSSEHIDEALNLFKKGKYDSVFSGFISKYLFWKSRNKTVIPMNYNPLNRQMRQEMKNQFIENGAIYITKYALLKNTNCRIGGKIGLYVMPEKLSIQIDSEHDLLFAEQILKRQKGE